MTFDVVEVIGNIIQENVTDLNPSRDKKKWVFPQYPEDATNLPEVVVKLSNVNFEPDSAGNFLYSDYNSETGIYKEYYYKKAIADLRLIVVTQKSNGQSASLEGEHDGNKMFLRNQTLNIFLLEKIKNVLWSNREDLLEYFDKFKLESIESSFDNNKWSWGGIIQNKVEYKDCFVKEIEDGTIVSEYSIGMIVTKV